VIEDLDLDLPPVDTAFGVDGVEVRPEGLADGRSAERGRGAAQVVEHRQVDPVVGDPLGHVARRRHVLAGVVRCRRVALIRLVGGRRRITLAVRCRIAVHIVSATRRQYEGQRRDQCGRSPRHRTIT
jgi:hypothetical protein